jgi:hypothetical protein
MPGVKLRRFGTIGVMLAASLFVAVVPASAEPNAGTADLGSALFKVGTKSQIKIATQAACVVDKPKKATVTTEAVSKNGISFGGGTSTCTRTVLDKADSVSSITAETVGKPFDLSALVNMDGPRVRLNVYKASCTGTQGKTSASWSFSGMSALPGLPAQIQSGYVYQMKNSKTGAELGTITFGEITTSNDNDGSLTMTALHIRFTDPTKVTGEVVLGTAACGPTP